MLALNRRATLAGLAAAGFALAFGAKLRAFAASIAVKATKIVNTVTSEPREEGGTPTPVAESQELPPETVIATAKESAAEFTYADGAILVVGQRSAATLSGAENRAVMTKGAFRVRATGVASAALASPLLAIEARNAEFVVAVADGQTICGVVAGEITCTSIKKGTSAKVGAGESIAWVSGSFGGGVTKGVFQTADIAVDQGIEAAALAWTPAVAPPPAPQ